MKKRVISWLLCLALCLSMLPMAALAEDVQAPEGPAPSMNEPQPEPRAKENETPDPESGAKVQSELMTAEKLLMPLSLGDENSPFSSISIVVLQNGTDIGDGNQGILNKSVTLYGDLICKDATQRKAIIKDSTISLTVDEVDFTSGFGGTTVPSEILVQASDFTPEKENYTITLSIEYGEYSKIITRDLTFKKCTHPSRNDSTGKCTECGAALVAELTAGASSSATYYDTLEEALSAAQTEANSGCTVKLLADCNLGNYELRKGSFMLDLDGHTLTQLGNPLWVSGTANLTVKNDRSGADYNGRFYLQSKTATLSLTIGSKYAKIMSDSSVGYILGPKMGYKVNNRNWADLNQLYRTYIENVTVEQAPFSTSDITVTPEDTYVNRKVTLAVTLDCLADGRDATCEYFVETSTSYGTTNSEQLKSPTLDAKTFTTDYTPKVPECTICARITSDDFYVIKKLEKTFKTCTHDQVNQDTGYCDRCDSQMAASVSPSALVGQRTYYETFDLAMNAAWDMLKTSDCWFTMFENANVGGALNNEYVTGGHTLYMVMNGKTLTSSSVVFSVPKDRWKLNFRAVGDSPGGTLIGKSRDWGGDLCAVGWFP